MKYVRGNFLCGLQGREPSGLEDLNAQLRAWVWGVANQRVHGTTHEQVLARWDADQFSLQPLDGRPPYPYVDDELRKVARDAYVSWQGSRYSVLWEYAGRSVWVRDRGGAVEVHYGASASRFTGRLRASIWQLPRPSIIAGFHSGCGESTRFWCAFRTPRR